MTTNSQRIRAEIARFGRESRAVRIPFRDRLRYWCYYFGLARRGVMRHSPTRDACYEDGFYKRGYDKYCEKINRRLGRGDPPQRDVPVPTFAHGELELAELRQLMRANIPFLLRDGAQGLPIRDWTLDYIESVAGACEVPINAAPDSPEDDLTRPSKAHHYYDFRIGRLSEVTASIRSGGNMRISTAEDVMHHAGGRLRQDLGLSYWEQIAGWHDNQHHWLKKRVLAGKVVGAQLLMQPENAFTLWHAEPADNFFVLARGRKRWWLADPYYTAAMRPRVKTTTNYFGSNIDSREPDDVQRRRGFAGYLGMPKVRVDMEPGDVLRVPNHWWHSVVTEPGSYVLAATIRAACMPNLVGPGFTLLRWFDRDYHVMAKDFLEQGRIHDKHIGYPRKSRGAVDQQSA